MNALEIPVPEVSTKTAPLRSLLIPLIAVLAILTSIIGGYVVNSLDIARNCRSNLGTYTTLVRIIDHVEHPAVLAGQKITKTQHDALHAYAQYLRDALPPKPNC